MTCHNEAMSIARELTVHEAWRGTVILRRTVKLAYRDDQGAEAFHTHNQETTVASKTNVKNLTYFVEPGVTKATGCSSDVFTGAGPNFGKRIAESHIITTTDGRKWFEAHCQPSAPVYSESWQSFFFSCVQQIHLDDACVLQDKKRTTRRLACVQPPNAPTIIWAKHLVDMPLAGYKIMTPAAIHQELHDKHCLKMPTTTNILNTYNFFFS